MPLKKSTGNMYSWVTHMHTHLGGECSHKCRYCYVGKSKWGRPERYKGDHRIIIPELQVRYGSGKIIFIEHMNDLFAESVDMDEISFILNHCHKYPDNRYVFQTKNPQRAFTIQEHIPKGSLIGTTIETTKEIPVTLSHAPSPIDRARGIQKFSEAGFETFVTIEPIMDLDVDLMVQWLVWIKPKFVNIGADSKNCGLPEPSKEKVLQLVKGLQDNNITIKKKFNLSRILGKGGG